MRKQQLWKYAIHKVTYCLDAEIHLQIMLIAPFPRYSNFDRSRSLKFIEFCSNWKPIFLLVINCDLSCILHHFRDILPQGWKSPHHSLSPPISENPSEFRNQTYHAKGWFILLLYSNNCMILAAVVLSQYTHIKSQMTDIWHMTVAKLCNAVATFS